jgi:hypothetical protein
MIPEDPDEIVPRIVRGIARAREIAFRTIEAFLSMRTPAEVIELISKTYGCTLTIPGVYRTLKQGGLEHLLLFVPPREQEIARLLDDAMAGRGDVIVVNSTLERAGLHVADAAADIVVELMRELVGKPSRDQRSRRPQLGLDGGPGMARAAFRIGLRLGSEDRVRGMTVRALVPSGFARDPMNEPWNAMASAGPPLHGTLEVKPLLSAPVLPREELARHRRENPSLRAGIAARDRLDIVLASLSSGQTCCGRLERWKKGWVPAAAGTARSAWLGELQSLPFDESGPVEFAKGHHPVTLFDWQAWHAFASRGGKSVVLAVQDCKRCRDHVARAVIALSRPPGPRAYTHLVVSKDTAYHALELLRRGGDDGDACLVSSLSS